MGTVSVSKAQGDADIRTVAEMWVRAAKRLADRGFDQWQYPVKTHNIRAAVNAGTCWLVRDSNFAIAGTITVDTNADSGLWYPSDNPSSALYLHRMIVEPNLAGAETGSALMDWVARRAAREGRRWIRLDAWRGNRGLRDYYSKRGFDVVRVVDDPTGSGACFQRSSDVQFGLGPDVVETV